MEICSNRLGGQHYHSINAVCALAHALGKSENFLLAEKLVRRACSVAASQLGKHHPTMRRANQILANVLGKLARDKPFYFKEQESLL